MNHTQDPRGSRNGGVGGGSVASSLVLASTHPHPIRPRCLLLDKRLVHPATPLFQRQAPSAGHLPSCPLPAPAAGSRLRTCELCPALRRPSIGSRDPRERFMPQATLAILKTPCPQSVPWSVRPALHCQLLFLPATEPKGAAFPWWGRKGRGGVAHAQGTCNLDGHEQRPAPY